MQLSYTFLLLSALSLSSVSAASAPRLNARLVTARGPTPRSFGQLFHGVSQSLNPLNARQLICGSGHTCTEACDSCGAGYIWCGTESAGSCDCADTSVGETCPGGVAPTPTAAQSTTPVIQTISPGSTEVCGQGKTCEQACGTCGPGSGWCGTYIDSNTCACYEAGDTCCSNGSTCKSGTFCALGGAYCCADGDSVSQCGVTQGFTVPAGQGTATGGGSLTIQTQTSDIIDTFSSVIGPEPTSTNDIFSEPSSAATTTDGGLGSGDTTTSTTPSLTTPSLATPSISVPSITPITTPSPSTTPLVQSVNGAMATGGANLMAVAVGAAGLLIAL